MKQYLSVPKVQIALLLFALFLLNSTRLGISSTLYLFITCVSFTILTDLGFTFLRRKKLFKPFAAIVTGLILTLIIDTTALWWQILIIAAAAMAMKNFVRVTDRHILNPASSGLLVGALLFGLEPSWWAATPFKSSGVGVLNILLYVLLAGIAYVSCYKLGRVVTVVSYIFLFALLFPFLTASLSPLIFFKTLINPGMLFYSFLMLPEPMTSPVKKKRQVLYGVIVAVVNALLVFATFTGRVGAMPDTSLVALLFGNIVFFKFR